MRKVKHSTKKLVVVKNRNRAYGTGQMMEIEYMDKHGFEYCVDEWTETIIDYIYDYGYDEYGDMFAIWEQLPVVNKEKTKFGQSKKKVASGSVPPLKASPPMSILGDAHMLL